MIDCRIVLLKLVTVLVIGTVAYGCSIPLFAPPESKDTSPIPAPAQSPVANLVYSFQIETRGPLMIGDPAIKYYLVLNTASVEDGPRSYGHWHIDEPRMGWHLPFYLSSETPTYHGTVTLYPVRFTDYFVLTTIAGVPQVIHGRLVGPNDTQGVPQLPVDGLFNTQNTLIENYQIMQKEQKWTVEGNTWNLTLTKDDLSVIPNSGNAPISANLFSTNNNTGGGDRIIDRWTLSENTFFTIKTLPGSLTSERNFVTPIIRPENKPSNVDANSVDFCAYRVEVRAILQ